MLDVPQMGAQGSGGLTMIDASLLVLPDSPSCQQLSKATARRGVGLHSMDILLCGGSWTGAVLLVLDSQGWLGKGSGKLNKIKGGGSGEQANSGYSGCESMTCVVFQ